MSQEEENGTAGTPVVTRDPRFQAGRKLVQKGLAQEGAVDIFATLVEEARSKYGDSSIETAPVYYEYGNALLRAASRPEEEEEEEEPANANVREVAAAAAEQRLKGSETVVAKKEEEEVAKGVEGVAKEEEVAKGVEDDNKKPAAVASNNDLKSEKKDSHDEKPSEEDDENDDDDGDDEGNDLNLALEMMENSFSILEEYRDSKSKTPPASAAAAYLGWVGEQLPRVLLGIGDTLSALDRHADAADAYSRALEFRQETLQAFSKEKDNATLEHLQTQRRVCEATVLICEELLACPSDQDVMTTETKSLIVTASELVEYVRGYYDKARDALQETVFLMGNLAARNIDLGTEKEDVCFIATMVMGVGTALAAIDDDDDGEKDEPVQKKQKL